MKKSDLTRQRLLEAATTEFATYGIAGARVDRIAANSGCNKQAIYAYFESKDRLFDAVYHTMVVSTVQSVPIDAADLAGYAARLFDRYRTCPEVLRLAHWQSLERDAAPHQASIEAEAVKVAAIQAAQDAGLVSRRYPARHLLDLVLTMSVIGAGTSPEASLTGASTEELRETLIDAVGRIVAP